MYRNDYEKDLEIKKLLDQLGEARLIVNSQEKKLLEARDIGNERNQFLQSQNSNWRSELRKKEAILNQADGYKMTLKHKIEEKDAKIVCLEQRYC
ncbi:hypothetical protein B9Z55_006918 [Caenorhabditis nigoni]|uniref:Uncharacterized protein n=1 Tax=Caenorhabditis nigoni TaxID=1611254 RepID=A0A2G5V7B8_9PELO|nr:hypothetical protein B9Z55_006918 [Caenorhabditis nigoni]